MVLSTEIENGPETEAILRDVQRYSADRQFKGYNKHDGLNSPLLKILLGWTKWSRILAVQGVMRFPFNLRPLLLVPKVYNPKGLALFVHSYLDLAAATADSVALQQAEDLLEVLTAQKSPGDWSGSAWGYHYPWQDPGFYAPTNTPNAVVTSFVCEAYLQAYRQTGSDHYLQQVANSIPFFLKDLPRLVDEPDRLCLGYMPMPMTMRVMDVSILVGAVLAQYRQLSGDEQYAEEARRLVAYVIGQQTEEGAWWYTDPPGDSHITHDNYHTGFILDALERYMSASGDRQWQSQYDLGLAFYADKLFAENGAPRWMSDCEWPHDIHGAAQGILTFSRHLDTHADLVQRILQWSVDNMYDKAGFFYYQQRPLWRTKTNLLRWCNGWMSRAMAALLAAQNERKKGSI